MSYLVHGIVPGAVQVLNADRQHTLYFAEEPQGPISNHRDDDWDYLWTDVGGES